MNNKVSIFLINVILALSILHFHHLHSACRNACSLQSKNPKISETLRILKKIPESRELIERALEGGTITVDLAFNRMPFEAMWEGTMRKIVIDGRTREDHGKMLRHLLFELHNAASESTYQNLYELALNGEMDCDSYVETIEKIEHDNMINTTAILEKGIAEGVFPIGARWEIVYDFATHYKIQQLSGHSLLIAREYQVMSKKNSSSIYRGTIKNLRQMSPKEKMSQASYLYTSYLQQLRINHSLPKEA